MTELAPHQRPKRFPGLVVWLLVLLILLAVVGAWFAFHPGFRWGQSGAHWAAAMPEGEFERRVRAYLLEHPEVSECGVVGRPDPRWDEIPIAYVIRRKGSQVRTDDLKAHIQSQLARFKVPREIVFVDDLPRTALGKVQHFMLKQLDAQTLVGGGVS